MSGALSAVRVRKGGNGLCALLVLFLCTLAPAHADHRSDGRIVTLGLLPVSSPLALFERFAPLRDYLSVQLGYDVRLISARDFPTFMHNTACGHYDLVLTAPHLVPLALDSGHYTLLATFKEEIRAAILVQEAGPVAQLRDLAGRMVATPPPAAIVTMVGADMIRNALAADDQPPEFNAYPNHNAAVQALALGFVEAAVVSLIISQQAIDQGVPVNRLATSRPIPGLGLLQRRTYPEALQVAVADTVIRMDQDEEGRAVLNNILVEGFVHADPDMFEFLRAFAPAIPPGDC